MKRSKHLISILEPYYSNDYTYDTYSFLTNIKYFEDEYIELKISLYPYTINEIYEQVSINNLLIISSDEYLYNTPSEKIRISFSNWSLENRVINVGNAKFGILVNEEIFDDEKIKPIINANVNSIIYATFSTNKEFVEMLNYFARGISIKNNIILIFLTLGKPLGPNNTRVYNALGKEISNREKTITAPFNLAEQIKIRNAIGASFYNLPKLEFSKYKGEPKRRITGRPEGTLVKWIAISTYKYEKRDYIVAQKEYTILNTRDKAELYYIFTTNLEKNISIKEVYAIQHLEKIPVNYHILKNKVSIALPNILMPGEEITFVTKYIINKNCNLKILTANFMNTTGIVNIQKGTHVFNVPPKEKIDLGTYIRYMWSDNNLNKDLEIKINYDT